MVPSIYPPTSPISVLGTDIVLEAAENSMPGDVFEGGWYAARFRLVQGERQIFIAPRFRTRVLGVRP